MRLTLAVLEQNKACQSGIDSFKARVGIDDGYEWTPEEAMRVHRENPMFLRWLEYKGLVPVLDVPGLPLATERQAAIDAFNERKKRLGV